MHDSATGAELTALSIDMNTDSMGGIFSDTPTTEVLNYPAPRLEPLCYPGVRPEYSFTTSESSVWPVNIVETEAGVQFGIATPEGVFDLNDALRYYGVSTMEERFPIVGFGSNACPGQLCEKFSVQQNKWDDITDDGDHHIVPTLKGSMRDVAAAYSSKLGIHGYMFAELIEAKGADTEVFVNFLSAGQLARMVRSEGSYELCDIGQVTIDGLTKPITAFGFAGKNPVLLDAAGKPILLESVHSTGTDMTSMSETALLQDIADEFGQALDAQYPLAPIFANSPSNLAAYASYRQEYLRRHNTGRIVYKNHPAESEAPDELVGVTFQNILQQAGRVSTDKLLDHLPIEKRGIAPHTFRQLYEN